MMWVDSKNIVPKEWVAIYYDNPDETPAEKLRCDTVVTVPGTLFYASKTVRALILTEISGGQYAVAVAGVVGDDFAKPWYQFFNSLLQDSAYEMLPKPCFEVYLNNGAEDGYWGIRNLCCGAAKNITNSSQGGVDAMTTLFESEKSKMRLQFFRSCREITLFPVCRIIQRRAFWPTDEL